MDRKPSLDGRPNRNERIAARFRIVARYSQPPKLPVFPDRNFQAQFHTSRWDYEYTGGNERGGWWAWRQSVSGH